MAQIEDPRAIQPQPGSRRPIQDRLVNAVHALALAASISVWFFAIRAPLWLDETGSYWQISKGFSQIWPRQSIAFPAYSYILWLSTKILGTSEIALRIPSILAMLGAVYLLYLAACELFDREIAFIAAIVFCLHPIVVLLAIDVRPYAFGALATNASILIVLRLRNNSSNWLPALFGLSAACIVYFHYLFAVILPALAICFFAVKTGNRKTLWRQFAVALAAFAVAFLPVIPGLFYLFHTAGTHVFEAAPKLLDLAWTLAPAWMAPIFAAVALVALLAAALATRRRASPNRFEGWQVVLCASLALIPILTLYGVSAGTSMHLFVERHRLIAVPGIALCWGFIVSRLQYRALRLLFCVALVAVTTCVNLNSPSSRSRHFVWKDALEVAQKNASADDAPVLICSDFPEADYAVMPLDSAKDSNLFSQLSYYKLSVPVVPLPRALNGEAIRVGSRFLQEAAQKHERFLAIADKASYKTLDWIAHSASGTYSVRRLGVFGDIEVLEFLPRLEQDVSQPVDPQLR